jgi:hypothetical protein
MLLRPFFRYSRVRDAYVLRLIGNSRGPVLRLVDETASAQAGDRRPDVPREVE